MGHSAGGVFTQILLDRGYGVAGVGINSAPTDGEAREVANELAFPNGTVITPDGTTLVVGESFAGRLTAFDIEDDGSLSNRRAWADGVGPDGICLDADGCIWALERSHGERLRAHPRGGEVLERIEFARPCSAAMLGGPDRRRSSCSPRTGAAPTRSRT